MEINPHVGDMILVTHSEYEHLIQGKMYPIIEVNIKECADDSSVMIIDEDGDNLYLFINHFHLKDGRIIDHTDSSALVELIKSIIEVW